MSWNEYITAIAFLIGIFAQACLLLRNLFDILFTVVIILASFLIVHFGLMEPGEPFGMTVTMATLLSILLFSLFYHDHLMPHMTLSIALHYSLLLYYAMHLSWLEETIAFPLWLGVVAGLPTLIVLVLGLMPGERGRFATYFTYIWFLICLCVAMFTQFSLVDIKALFGDFEKSLMDIAYAFTLGMAFLFLASNIIYLFILIAPAKRNYLLDSLFGSPDQIKDEMIDGKVAHGNFSVLNVVLLVIHGGLLVVNVLHPFMDPAMAITASIATILVVNAFTSPAPHPHEAEEPEIEEPFTSD